MVILLLLLTYPVVFPKDQSWGHFFLIYINHLPDSSNFLSFFLFADDTNIYCESDNLQLLTKKVNKELKKVKLWLDSNKLALNIEKTNCELFHSPWKKLTEHNNLKIGKQNIQRTKYVKFLGVLMDEHLTWKYHSTELCKKLSKTAGIFFKVRHYVPLPTLISLYNSIFLPFLNYGISAWGMTYEFYLDPLFKLQKKILRCIRFEPFSSPSTPILKSLKFLKMEDILHLNTLTFVYKSIKKLSSSYFHDYFQPNSSVHRIGTRQATRGDLFKSFKTLPCMVIKQFNFLVQNFGTLSHCSYALLALFWFFVQN